MAGLFVIAFARLAGRELAGGLRLARQGVGREQLHTEPGLLDVKMVLINNKAVVITSCFGGHMTLWHNHHANNDFMASSLVYALFSPPPALSVKGASCPLLHLCLLVFVLKTASFMLRFLVY